MEKKKYGYYKQGKGITPRPELIRQFEAEKMDHDKDYVTFIVLVDKALSKAFPCK